MFDEHFMFGDIRLLGADRAVAWGWLMGQG